MTGKSTVKHLLFKRLEALLNVETIAECKIRFSTGPHFIILGK